MLWIDAAWLSYYKCNGICDKGVFMSINEKNCSERSYNEKRDFIRMKINSQLTMRQNGQDYEGICKDLSGAGMYVRSEQSFEPGSKLEVSIAQQGETHLPFNATAEVSRIEPTEDGQFSIGLSIKEIRD